VSELSDALGRFGVWLGSAKLSPELASTIEGLGYGAVWMGSAPGDLQLAEQLLDATTTLTVATGIVNIWTYDAASVAAACHRVQARHPGRFLLGIGVGHPEATGARYAKPYQALVQYLDELDAAQVPLDRRVLAALGPKVLRLSADRSAGAHPYLTTPEHTRGAREILGAGVLLAPEQKVVVDRDPVRARSIGRAVVEKPYLGLVNYTNNLRSLGYTDEDLAGGGSDRLIDDLVAHGDAASIAARLTAHLDAGADHVSIQPLTAAGADPVPGLTELAEVLFA
jgi:probable F420-dependent oxidoreductase